MCVCVFEALGPFFCCLTHASCGPLHVARHVDLLTQTTSSTLSDVNSTSCTPRNPLIDPIIRGKNRSKTVKFTNGKMSCETVCVIV